MSSTKRISPRLRRSMAAAAMVTGLALALGLYDAAAAALAARPEKRAHDPATGLLAGAEPRLLGPEDAPVAVLLVHGFVGAGNNFGELPERLAAHGWRVDVMRLPGHGTHPSALQKVTAAQLIEAVDSELELLRANHERVAVVGHSMGGALATLVAAHRSADALVLAAPYFGITGHWYYVLPPRTWFNAVSPVVPWWYKGEVFLQVNRKEAKPHIVSYTWIPTQALRTLMELGDQASNPTVLQNITCPVLLVHGEGDVAASLKEAAKAVEAMNAPIKETVTLDRSNHHIFWDYDAERTNAAIETFLERHLQK